MGVKYCKSIVLYGNFFLALTVSIILTLFSLSTTLSVHLVCFLEPPSRVAASFTWRTT